MSKILYKQGDILYMDFSPAVVFEMEGTHPAVIVSNDRYNRNSGYLMVVPITSGGTYFNGYVNLVGYKYIYGRVNTTQIHCYSQERARSLPMERLRLEDFDKVKRQIGRVINDSCI